MKLTKEKFLESVATHQLTINLDQGVYRDITVAEPNDINMHFNITTRPGYLIFTGDMGSFTFSRTNDMFAFFRRKGGEISPDYWGEKLEAADKRAGFEGFSSEVAKELLIDHLNDHVEGLDCGYSPTDDSHASQAKDAIENLIGLAESDEHEFFSELRNWDAGESGGLDMDCWWEWDFSDYTYRYLWCCYAIVHAIKLYDEAKVEVA